MVVEIPPASRCFCKQKFDNAQNDNDEKCTVRDARPYMAGEQSCAPTMEKLGCV